MGLPYMLSIWEQESSTYRFENLRKALKLLSIYEVLYGVTSKLAYEESNLDLELNLTSNLGGRWQERSYYALLNIM